MDVYAGRIIKELEKCTGGARRQSDVFDDWLDVCLTALEALPAHAREAVASRKLAADTPETQALYEKLRESYSKDIFVHFARALGDLLNSANEWNDTIGDVYMEFGHPSKSGGQYFTPFALAELMAKSTMGNVEGELHKRIQAAIRDEPLAQALLMAGAILDGEEALQHFVTRIVPSVAERIEPVRVTDPACGSGVMLLAAAKQCPRWALDYGLVQFWGTDIDPNCVKMAKVNMMLHGLNGYGLQLAVSVMGAQPEQREAVKVEPVKALAPVKPGIQLTLGV